MQVQAAVSPLTYRPRSVASAASQEKEAEKPGLTGDEMARSLIYGGGAFTVGAAYPTVWLHEMGHALTANALYQGANPHITINPLQGGVTRWTPGPLTELGQKLGPEHARAAVAAAGTVIDVGIATTSFAAGYMMRKKHPVAGAVLMGYAGMSMANTVMYAASALQAASAGNDFATFAAMTGIHPAITLGAMVAILPAEYLLLRHLEQKGII